MNKDIKVIAFYLPQFHTIPENDEAYGKGFTEWTNVKKAEPLFTGHNQPRIPLNDNYYCLLDDGVMKEQAKLAKENGVYGFCYYHYWFKGGKLLLEKPLEKMLGDKEVDIPFCICWANENWSKRWDGGNNELIVEQDYDDLGDVEKHINYLKDYFQDDRYIRVDGKPLFIVYKPELIPNLRKYICKIRDAARMNGIGELCISCQYPKYYMEGVGLDIFDYYIQFQPRFLKENAMNERRGNLAKTIKRIMISLRLREFGKSVRSIFIKENTEGKILEKRNYDEDWAEILNYKVKDEKLIAGAFVDWDNTPRNKNGLTYLGAEPQKFKVYMRKLFFKVRNEYNQKYIFINAWNEWAEGAYLEPDEKYKYGYLEALKETLGE